MKNLFIVAFLLLGVLPGFCQSQNYIKVWEVTRPGITDPQEVAQLPLEDGSLTTLYADGLGRTIQTVSRRVSPAKKDLVTTNAFDVLGRQARTYLPYISNSTNGEFKTDPLNEQQGFYNNVFPGEGHLYSETHYEESSLERMLGESRAGNNWGGSNRKQLFEYNVNQAAGNLHIWSVGPGSDALPVTSPTAVYAPRTLWVAGVVNEEQNKVNAFSDFKGNTVLQQVQHKATNTLGEYEGWLSTYYVYDDFNRLRYVITPKAVQWLLSHDWLLTPQIADELCYKYTYDGRGRLISKKQPGAAAVEMVYDQRGRRVFVRDAIDQEKGRWQVSLYDVLDRVTVTGFIQSELTRAELQSQLSQQAILTTTIQTGVNSNEGMLKNLVVSTRENGRTAYKASNQVSFEEGFVSEDNAEFIAEITKPVPQPFNQQVTVSGNPLPPNTTLVALTVNYYDDYSFAAAQPFSTNFQFAPNNNPNALPVHATTRSQNMLTGQQLRIVEGDNYEADAFLTTTFYFDERGNPVQQISDNYLKGTDINTSQYEFSGLPVANCLVQDLPGTSIRNFTTGTSYEYDAAGRLLSLSKSYGGQAYRKIVESTYDELGNMQTQKLGADYNNGNGLETLHYDYNLQGWLTGINSAFVKATSVSAQWDHYFGEVLGYENTGNLFTNARYDGSAGGAIWKSQGDNIPRKYNYEYTPSDFIAKANYTQAEQLGAGWSNTKMDASVPLIDYDLNGNITALQQKGLLPGQAVPVLIDDLTYRYDKEGNSNKLVAVQDNAVNGTLNGVAGDFKNGENLPAEQYSYDVAGSLINDYNKDIRKEGATGIEYSVLNKPYKVTVQGKYVLEYVYDAAGTLLARKTSNISVTPNIEQWQYYINGLVLYDQQPQYFDNEAGRLRISQVKNSPANSAPTLEIGGNNGLVIDGRPAFFDYYIMDQQGSARVVLTEEEHREGHLATMEISDASRQGYEETMFGKVNAAGQPDAGNELVATRENITPAWSSHYNDPANQKASRVHQANPVGPNALLKVMAGDVFNLGTDYFYNETPVAGNNGLGNITNSLLSAFTTSLPAVNAGAKDAVTQLQSAFLDPAGALSGYLSSPDNSTPGSTVPQAYLNWIFFDENFNVVSYDAATGLGSSAKRVTTAGDGQLLTAIGIKAPRNGYVFVYVSNTSNSSVWFDNLAITHERSRLMQEHHYYPYGLQIAAISSKSYGKLDNYFRYQGAYSQFEEETGWINFDLRSYDAQLGRWTGIDPYDQFASGYMGMGGNPVNGIDPDGGSYNGINWLNVAGNTFTTWEIIGSRVINTLAGAAAGGLINSVANGWNWRNFGQGAAWGGVAGLAATYIPWGDAGGAIGSAAGWSWNKLGSFFQEVEINSVKFAIYQDKEDYDRVKNSYKQGKWLFVGAKTIQDALSKIPTKYKKKSFKNLIISSHGKAGVSNIMKESVMGNVVLEAAFKGDLQKAPENAHFVDAVNALAEVLDYLKDGGNCFFTGCNSGSGTVGESYGKNLVSLGGCRFDLYMNQDQGADAFQEDLSGKPTGRTMLHDRNGSFNSTYNDGWRKFSIGENGAVKMENLQKKKGGKVIKKGVVFLNYDGQLVFP